jgi:NAD+-dependent secondary alcohol dehydrogenase Adh1
VGCGGKLELSTLDITMSEKSIIGILNGSFMDLYELIELVKRGQVRVTTREFPLSKANDILHDLHNGRVMGRTVLIP